MFLRHSGHGSVIRSPLTPVHLALTSWVLACLTVQRSANWREGGARGICTTGMMLKDWDVRLLYTSGGMRYFLNVYYRGGTGRVTQGSSPSNRK